MPKGLRLIEDLMPQLGGTALKEEKSYFHKLLRQHKAWAMFNLTKVHPKEFGIDINVTKLTDEEYLACFLFTVIMQVDLTEIEIKSAWNRWPKAKTRFENSMERLQELIELTTRIKESMPPEPPESEDDRPTIDQSFWPGRNSKD